MRHQVNEREKNWNKNRVLFYCRFVWLLLWSNLRFYRILQFYALKDCSRCVCTKNFSICSASVSRCCYLLKILQVNLSLAYFIVSKVLMTEWWRYQTEKHGKEIKIKHQSKIAANSANGTFCSSHILLYFQWNERKIKCEKKDCCSLAVNRKKKLLLLAAWFAHTHIHAHTVRS